MNKLYLVTQEANLDSDLSKALAKYRNQLIEANNGLWHLSKHGLPDGGTKYDCLEYIIGCEQYFDNQFVIFVWNSQFYHWTELGQRLLNWCRELIIDDNKKTRVIVVDSNEMKMKDLATLIMRTIDNIDTDKVTKQHIVGHMEFPNGLQAFELEH